MPSSLRAYVQWKNQTVFAGEEIECVITFKNIARTAQQRATAQSKQRSRLDSLQPIHERQGNNTRSPTLNKTPLPRAPSTNSVATVPQNRGHQHSLSLGVEPSTTPTDHGSVQARPKAHGRSLSILSIGTGGTSPVAPRNSITSPALRGHHGKSASVQLLPRGLSYPTLGIRSHPTSPSLQEKESSANGSAQEKSKADRRKSMPPVGTGASAPSQGRNRSETISTGLGLSGFEMPKFDDTEPPTTLTEVPQVRDQVRRQPQISSPLSPDKDPDHLAPTLGPKASHNGDSHGQDPSRNSSDIYSLSNASDETVSSELHPQTATRGGLRPTLLGRISQRRESRMVDRPEHLMMGYVQTKGSFIVDGSLVDQGPFEEVKRKGVVSSQGGGGVVGVERANRSSNLLGGFGWASIGESINGLLGMDEMSSMREMKNVANLREVPLLSTPQSILFVDLHLAPGESRSYTYRFEIPRGLPPTHKGRALKVSYHLRIAVQRSGSVESRNMTDVEIPFCVLGSVNRDGEVLGHDLMSPYILLQDTARTSLLPTTQDATHFFSTDTSKKPRGSNASSTDSFLRYTQELLDEQDPAAPLVSPTTPTASRRFSADLHARTMHERIDLAILRSNRNVNSQADGGGPSTNRFTITRLGQHVGVLTIPRAAYRLGETVHVKLDFGLPGQGEESLRFDNTYTVSVVLETLENIDPSLALRGAASIVRATRKMHAAETQTVLYARQAGVSLEIPAQATPTFDTSGVQLQWRLRVEFTTSALPATAPPEFEVEEEEEESTQVDGELLETKEEPDRTAAPALDAGVSGDGLLELLSEDDRGQILVAKELIAADSWEVTVPLRVYGQAANTGAVSDVLEI